jgi:sucrose synthase
MTNLLDILEAPAPGSLEIFLSRIPMIFSIAIISPHGFFGQEKVLGRPDTGGQVVYILDQVRALEKEMRDRLYEQGLVDIDPRIIVLTRLIPESEGTNCHERIETISRTLNSYILRVPFRFKNGDIVPHWISRFEIWPYLERFAMDAGRELLAEISLLATTPTATWLQHSFHTSSVLPSATLPMHWKRQNISIRIFTGRITTPTTISPASSRLISLP